MFVGRIRKVCHGAPLGIDFWDDLYLHTFKDCMFYTKFRLISQSSYVKFGKFYSNWVQIAS